MKWVQWLIAAVAVGCVAACGGGGGGKSLYGSTTSSGTSGSTSTSTGTVTVALSSSTVTSAAPVTVTATVTSASGAVVSNQVVTFATTNGYGTFSPNSALTNASGIASVYLFPASSTTVGADTVVATAALGTGSTVTGKVGFSTTAANVSISSFVSDVGVGSLSPYGQTALTVNVSGAAAGAAVGLTLSSTCVQSGKATLTPSSLSTTTGVATFTYKDNGCGAVQTNDTVQASVTGSTSTSTLNVALTAPAASSITFASASPQTIYLKGSGFTETSAVSFQVKDFAGNPLPNKSILLGATTYTGGLTIDGGSAAVTKTSDANGNVSVLVNSGTVPTPVRIKATLVGGAISTSSSSLSIAVGLPSELNFSLSQKTLNIEGYDIDGTSNAYTIYAADRMGNPVPAGTAINFISEGGQIVGSSQIALSNGIASSTVNFVSAEPRPQDGRITIVSYALGEESFIDANGNNVYDAGEDFQDLGDVFVSRAYLPTYAPATDQRIAYTLSAPAANCVAGSSSLLALNVTMPSVTTYNSAPRCDGVWGSAFVRRAVETVLSTSASYPLWADNTTCTANCSSRTLVYDAYGDTLNFTVLGGSTVNVAHANGVLSFLAADANPYRLNPMAAGTTISVTATTGLSAAITGGTPVPSTNSVTAAGFSYAFTSGTTSGNVTLSFTSPSGLVSSWTIGLSCSSTNSVCNP